MWDAQIFVSVRGASGYLYAEATRGQDLASWLGAHVRALECYGGSARVVVLDYVARHIIRLLFPIRLCGRERRLHLRIRRWAAQTGHITIRARPANS